MADVETPKPVQETDGSVESKETTAASGKILSPTKLKEAMKEPEKKSEDKKSEETEMESDKKCEETETEAEVNGDKTANETVEALNLLAQGKRNMLCGEVPQAVTQLQEACRLLASKFGDTADECGEAYLCYGTALLDLSRMESGVLGNALDGIDSEDDDKASPDEEEEKMTDSDDKSSETSAATSAESEDIADEEEEAEGEEAEANESVEEGEASADSADEGKPGTSKEKEEEDVSHLQLAWEILELAKLIYTRHESKEMKLKAAEAHLKLGEVGLETEQYETSIDDFEKCLALQQIHLEAESRLIAETHYQIGLASCFAQKYDTSLKHLRKAVEVIRNKIKKLEELIAEAEKPENKDKEVNAFDDPIPGAKKELVDLSEILPDILAKIEDTEDEKISQEKVKKMVKENLAGSSSTEESTTSSFDAPSSSDNAEAKPVSDISHLVRKKRKPEEEEANDESKKAKTEETNGAGDAKPVEAST